MEVFEVWFDHQIEGHRVAVFSSFQKADKFLTDQGCVLTYTFDNHWCYKATHGQEFYIDRTKVL